MFKLFGNRKEKNKKNNQSSQAIEKITDEQRADLQKEIEVGLAKLDTFQADERIQLLNQLGKDYQALNDFDNAIKYFETSITEKKAFGDAYTGLLSLYEKKRKYAAQTKNDDQIQFYVNKLDSLMKISKEIVFNK